MKNKEKFKNEIVDIICNGDSIAVDKETHTPISCCNTKCGSCLFYTEESLCIDALVNWSNKEYKEPSVISYHDSLFLNFITDEYEYMARDKNGKLFIHKTEPFKYQDIGVWDSQDAGWIFSLNIVFPMIKWEDKEPWKISDLKKLKVVKNY